MMKNVSNSGKNANSNDKRRRLSSLCIFCLIAISLLFVINNSTSAQCNYNNTYEATWVAPAAIGDSVYTTCIFGGKYIRVTGMVAGETYRVSNCGNENFDSQITIYPAGGGSYVAYNDDYCGVQASIDFTPEFSGDYDILVNELYCSPNTACMYLVVEKMPCPPVYAEIYTYPNPVCPNTDVYIETYGTATSYLWDFGDGSPTSNLRDNYHSYSSVGNYTVSAIMSNECGSDTTLSQIIEVNNLLPITDVYSYVSDNEVCPNTEVYFEAYGYEGNLSFVWNFGDGSPTDTKSNPYHTYTLIGNYTASVTISNSCGNDTILYNTIDVVSNIPVTNVYSSASPNIACPNTEVYFQAWGDANSYLWNFGDGSPTSNLSYTTHSYSSFGSYTASVFVSNTCGNDTTFYHTIDIVNSIPVTNVYAYANPVSVCPNSPVYFEAYGDGDTYLWNFGDGSPGSTIQTQSHTYVALGTYTASVFITNSCGSDTTLYLTIDVINSIPVSFANSYVSESAICPNSSVYFQAWGDDIESYLWNFGDGSPTSTSAYLDHIYTALGTYTASITMTNSCGSDTIFYHTINVGNNFEPITDVYANINPNPACPNTMVSFSAWGYESNYTYLWNFGDGSPTSTSSYTYHNYASIGNYATSVKISNSCGNDTTLYQTVFIKNNVPVTNVGFDGYPNYVCPNTEIHFAPWGEGVSFLWDFGDGSPASSETNPYHAYQNFGTYQASVTITNSCGSDTTIYRDMYVVNNLPVNYANFDISPNPVCPNSEVRFDAWGNGNSFVWNFGDGSPSSNASYTYHSYAAIGNYPVSVKIANSCGKDTTLYSTVVVTNNLPIEYAEIHVSPNPVCPTAEVHFDVWGDFVSYLWDFGDGSPTATSDYARHTYLSNGSYTASVKLTNACGSDTTLYEIVEVADNLPVTDVSLLVFPNPVCPNTMISFEVDGNGGTYLFDYGDGSPLTSSQYHSYTLAGNYDASVKITNKCGNDTVVHQTIYVANDLPMENANIEVYPNPVCPNTEVEFHVWSSGVTYEWDFGDGSALASSNETKHNYALPGIYNVSVKITNACGNQGTFYRTVDVLNSLPVYYNEIEIYPNPVCPDDDVQFRAWGDAISYLWNFGDGSPTINMQSTLHKYDASGTYEVSLKMTNGCGSEATVYRSVVVGDSIVPDPNQYEYDVFPVACLGDSAIFYVQSGAGTYLWDFGDGTSTTVTRTQVVDNDFAIDMAMHKYAALGTYPVTFTLTNGCGNSFTDNFSVLIASDIPVQGEFWWIEDENVAGKPIQFLAYGGSTYNWDFGDGTSAISSSGSLIPVYHTYASPGYYIITVTIANSCGNTEVLTSDINIGSTSQVFCNAQFDYWSEGVTGFSDLSTGNITAWSWDFGDGTYSTLKNPEHTYSVGGAYTVTLTILDEITGCISTISKMVISGTVSCQADFNFTINSVSGLTNFTSTSQNATNYYWDFGDGSFSTLVNPNYTYTKAGSYKVCLTIRNSTSGCQSVICKNVLFSPAASVFIVADFSFFTDPASYKVNFSDLSSSNTTDWYWTMGDGKVIMDENPVYTYSKPGVYKVCLTAIDRINLLAESICKEVRVGEIECAIGSDFGFFIDPVDRKVEFFSKVTGTVTNYFWTFGDGGSSALESPTYTYSTPGFYLVTLSVRNSANKCMDMSAQFIQVGSVDCSAGFSYVINPLNNNVSFEDDSKGQIDYYYWDFGNGSYSVLGNPENLYKSAGMYTVGQTVIDNVNGCIDYSEKIIQVGEVDCAAEFVSYIDPESSTAYFTNKILGESTALLWSFGDGRFSTNDDPVHVFPGNGIYSVGLNTFDFESGCMDYYQEMLLIGGLGIDCEADFVYRADPANPDVIFSNKSIGDVVGSVWSFGDNTENSEETNPLHTYSKGGYYYVCLNVTNSVGTRNMTCKWVLVEGGSAANCRANFMYSVDSTTKKATFVDNSFGDINKYTWDFGDSKADSVSSLTNPTHTYNDKGYYLVQLKVENTTSGCVSNEYKLLNIAELQVLKASFGYEARDPDKKVSGYPVDLVSASSGDGATVEWDFGDKQIKKESLAFTVMDSTSGIITHYYEKPGKYRVCVRITDKVSGQTDEYCQFVFTKNAVNVADMVITGIDLNVYPNPFIDYTIIKYSLPDNQFAEIAIFDQLGRRIETLVKTRKDAGEYQIVWETKNQTPGIYHLKLITPGKIITKQLVITK